MLSNATRRCYRFHYMLFGAKCYCILDYPESVWVQSYIIYHHFITLRPFQDAPVQTDMAPCSLPAAIHSHSGSMSPLTTHQRHVAMKKNSDRFPGLNFCCSPTQAAVAMGMTPQLHQWDAWLSRIVTRMAWHWVTFWTEVRQVSLSTTNEGVEQHIDWELEPSCLWSSHICPIIISDIPIS